MITLLNQLFGRGEPKLSEAESRDAAAIAALHAASFHRGWSEQEVDGLLLDRHVIAHRALGWSRTKRKSSRSRWRALRKAVGWRASY